MSKNLPTGNFNSSFLVQRQPSTISQIAQNFLSKMPEEYLQEAESIEAPFERRLLRVQRENEGRISNLGSGIGVALRWISTQIFGAEKKEALLQAPKKTLRREVDDFIDQKLQEKPLKSSFFLWQTGSYFTIPKPTIYDPEITIADKTMTELRAIKNASNELIVAGNGSFENYWERAISSFYLHANRAQMKSNDFKHFYEDPSISRDYHGHIYDSFENHNSIVSDFKKAFKLNNESYLPSLYNGFLHLSINRMQVAKQCFQEVVAINPKLPWLNHCIGMGSHHRKKEAIRHYENEMQINPNGQSLLELARIEFSEKKYDQSLKLLEQAEKHDPNTKMIYLEMSKIYKVKGNKELELEYLNKELHNSEYHKDHHLRNMVSRHLGYCHLENKRPEAALKIFDRLIAEPLFSQRYSLLHNFDRANAVAMIEGVPKAEQEMENKIRKSFVNSGTMERSVAAPVYYNSYKLLAEFRIQHYGFDVAKERLEESMKKIDTLSNKPEKEHHLRLSYEVEMASLLVVHSKSLQKSDPKQAHELCLQAKTHLEGEDANRSYAVIKKELLNAIKNIEDRKKPKHSPAPERANKLQISVPQQQI